MGCLVQLGIFEIMTKKKDLIYLGIIAVGLIAHFVIIEEVKHKSSWCDQFFQEFREGL